MFYAKRCPADAPYFAHVNELHEWTHHQRKHHERVQVPTNVVDSSPPKCNGMASRAVQERGRTFCQDQRKAEIGRENRKIVDRLQRIANGLQAPDPRGPPRRADGLPGSPSLPTLSSSPSQSASEPPRIGSLNEQLRRRVQRGVETDNVGLVRRILTTRSTLDNRREAADFSRHRRTEQLLRRLPDAERRASPPPSWRSSPMRSALPALPKDAEALARELQGNLFLLADLRRAGPAPLALQHSASAPAVVPGRRAAPPGGSAEDSPRERPRASELPEDGGAVDEEDVQEDVQEDVREDVKEDVQEDVKEDVRQDAQVGAQEEGVGAAKHRPGGPAPQTWGAENVDGETERRRWLEQDGKGAQDQGADAPSAAQQPGVGVGAAPGAAPPAAPAVAPRDDARASEGSDDVPYDDDWDDASMTDETVSMSRTNRTRSDGFGLTGGG